MKRAKRRHFPRWSYVELWEFSRALGKMAEASRELVRALTPLPDAIRAAWYEALHAKAPKAATALANAKAEYAITMVRIQSRRST